MTDNVNNEEIKKKGFDLFCKKDAVRRLTPNITAVKGDFEGYYIVELKDGRWICECSCFTQNGEYCEHIYAAQVTKNTNRNIETETTQHNESSLKCRYCSSPDISRCGFRYNRRGISRRYYCNECERKFSIRIIESNQAILTTPSEMVWLLNQIGLQVSKLSELLIQLDIKLTRFSKM